MEAVATELAEHLKRAGFTQDHMRDDILESLEYLSLPCTGYDLAVVLDERYIWCCDEDLLNALEIVPSLFESCTSKAVAAWVCSNDIRPKQKVGDKVVVKECAVVFGRELREYEGEVSSINSQQATYLIYVPALGHVKEVLGTHGLVMPFEQVHELATPAESFSLTPG